MTNINVALCRNCGKVICTSEDGGWVHALPIIGALGEEVDLSTACTPDFDGSLIADPAEGPHRPTPPVTLNGTAI